VLIPFAGFAVSVVLLLNHGVGLLPREMAGVCEERYRGCCREIDRQRRQVMRR